MLHDVNPRGRGARLLIGRLRHLLAAGGAEKRCGVRPDRPGAGGPAHAPRRDWFIYGAYRAAGTENPGQAGPS